MNPAPICCCIPLKFGCNLVGTYNLLDFLVKLGSAVQFVVPRLQQGSVDLTVGDSLWLYLTVLQCGTQLTLGVCVLLGTLLERHRLLRSCAGFLLLLAFVSLVLGTVTSFYYLLPRTFFTYLLDFIVLSFCSFVVSAHGAELKSADSARQELS